MCANGMPGGGDLFQDLRIIGRVFADREENAGRALVRERLEDGWCVLRSRAVAEGQNDFLVAQEVELFEVLESKTRTAGRVDLDDAADAERVRVGAGHFC